MLTIEKIIIECRALELFAQEADNIFLLVHNRYELYYVTPHVSARTKSRGSHESHTACDIIILRYK